MEDIHILIYTDFFFIGEDPALPWSVSHLLRFASLKTKGVANVSFTVMSRHSSAGVKRLYKSTLEKFEEVWLFSFYHIIDPPFGLDSQELHDIAEWMDSGGGVLITGDHSIPRTLENGEIDHGTFWAHGRALGSQIIRAGQLRVWEGPPTDGGDVDLPLRDNFNTQEGDDPNALDSLVLQSDGLPQTLLEEQIIHPLFLWRQKNGYEIPITKFPDHQHEGKLVRPEELNEKWTKQLSLPVVAARGRDKRFPGQLKAYDLVVAYDGSLLNKNASDDVGRIVADSSFHHYLDPNLKGLSAMDCCGNPLPDSDLDQIAQYYGNLTLWLIPKELRRKIKLGLFLKAAFHPDVLEIAGSSKPKLANVAKYALQHEVGLSHLTRLLRQSSSETQNENALNELLRELFLVEQSTRFEKADSQIILGSIIRTLHLFHGNAIPFVPQSLDEVPLKSLVIQGLESTKESIAGIDEILSNLRPMLD
jgi:hypothetical protein